MTVREIRLFGDPVLKTVCDTVTDFEAASTLIADLLETTQLPGRAGVAAPQIGVSLRAFSYNVHSKVGYLINPKIIETFGELKPTDEGCLSVPGLWHPTPRYAKVIIRGQLLDQSTVEFTAEGLLAQAMQHECDHLDGKVYLDRLELEERRLAMKKLRDTDWFLKI
ncbi:MAG: peptide deformylase [Micrococcales bacterium]